MRWMTMVVLLGVAGVARADAPDATAQAREHYGLGLKYYNLSHFDEALKEFEAAYLAKPDPAFLFNLGQCQRQLGQYDAAEKSYRAFLREAADISPQQRAEVQRLIVEMERAAREQVARQPPTTIQPPREQTPPAEAARPTAPPPEAPPPPPPPRPRYARPAAWGVTAAGVALAVVGAALGGQGEALLAQSREAMTLPEARRAVEDSDTFRVTGYALLGAGAAALVTGVVLFALPERARRFAAAAPGGLQVTW